MAPVKSVILGSAAALITAGLASAGDCSGPVINSISYCNAVDQIVYDDVGYSGTYQDVTGMDLDSCTCNYGAKAFSGPLAPLNEGLSVHFRGPMHLKQFAAYYPAPKKEKRSHSHHKLGRHHAHHKRALRIETVTQTIVVDPSGSTIWPKPTSTQPALYGSTTETPSKDEGEGEGESDGKGKSKDDTPKFEYPDVDDDSELPDGSWVRTSYYNAEEQTSNGLVFMNHRGGQGSGVFDMKCAGQSISYMTPDAKNGSEKPQILQNSAIKTRDEFIIFSDQKCTTETCGFYRPGIPAYQGFAGDKKIFVFEFSMPEDKTSDSFNDDLPAIWLLNSKIPRTAQYGFIDKPCSCWDSGCGELDIFEVLKDANSMVKTHYHSDQGAVGQYGGGGNKDFFPRPYDKYVKYAVYFDGNKAVKITKLPGSTPFPESFNGDALTGKIAGISISTFKVPQ